MPPHGVPVGGDRRPEMLTARLSLRRPTAADIDAILAIHSDPLACAHNPSDSLHSRAEAEVLFEQWNDHWERFGFGYWVVRRHGSDLQLGFCGMRFMHLRQRRVLNLFYRFDPACWGAGIGSEAATAVAGWAGAQLPAYPLVARVRPDNVASQRVAVRAGLVRAEHLDEQGIDGYDWIYVTGWPGRCRTV